MEMTYIPETGELISPPLPPSEKYWLGTDRQGRDLLTLLLYGARYTLVAALGIAFLRLLLGAIGGMLAGLRKKKPGRAILPKGLIGGIPPFLIVYFFMFPINFSSALFQSPFSGWELTLIQSALMTVIGIPALFLVTRDKTRILKQKDYITAAQTMGAGKRHILMKHILPGLREDLSLLYLHEVVTVINLIGQLAILKVFLGGTFFNMDSGTFNSLTFEWAGLIGKEQMMLEHMPRFLLAPLGAYLLLITSLYLILRGLEERTGRNRPTPRM